MSDWLPVVSTSLSYFHDVRVNLTIVFIKVSAYYLKPLLLISLSDAKVALVISVCLSPDISLLSKTGNDYFLSHSNPGIMCLRGILEDGERS